MNRAMAGADAAAGPPADGRQAAWPAVVSLTLGVFSLITTEFLPASLLTPIARSLRVSEALAGQAITATAVVAFFSSLLASTVTRRLDRRLVLMGFSAILVLSNLLVAAAPNLPLLLLGRVLLGVALGGFWSMSTAITIRLVPAAAVPRAMSLVFSGSSVASIVAVPLGSYVGGLYSWRVVFLLAAGLGVVTLAVQAATLPRLPRLGGVRPGTLRAVLGRPGIGIGMVCIVLNFSGHFGLFTYLRPFLETTAAVGSEGVSLILLAFGLANLAGTVLASVLMGSWLRSALCFTPLLVATAAFGLAGLHAGTVGLVALWGLAFGIFPVGWSTWLARAVPDETEGGGGLIVAAVQLAITLGAAGGGVVYSGAGVSSVFTVFGGLLLAASVLVFARLGNGPTLPRDPHPS